MRTGKTIEPFQGSKTHENVMKTFLGSLTTSYILQICFVILGVMLSVFWYRRRQRGRLGPKQWPFLGSIIEQLRNYSRMHDWLLSYLQINWTACVPMPFGGMRYFTACPDNVKHLLQTNSTNYPKSNKRMEELLGNCVDEVEDKWIMTRWPISEYHRPSLGEVSALAFKEKACKLAGLVSQVAYEGISVDIQELLLRITLEALGEVGFGAEISPLPIQLPLPRSEFAEAFDSANDIMTRRFIDPLWKVKRILGLGDEGKLANSIKVIDDFTHKVIVERKLELLSHLTWSIKIGAVDMEDRAETGRSTKFSDIISTFLAHNDNSDHHKLDEKLRNMVLNFVVSSRNTTAVTLTWFVYMMTQNQDIAYRLYEELREFHDRRQTASESSTGYEWIELDVDDAVEDDIDEQVKRQKAYLDVVNRRVQAFSAILTSDSLRELTYLQAVLQETMRLFPAVPLDPREIAADDQLPDKTEVASGRGNTIFFAPYCMARMSSIWGPDAKTFNPNRWLEKGKLTPIPESEYKFLAFQAHLHTNVPAESTVENLKIVAATLCRFFEFINAGPMNRPAHYRMASTLLVQNGLNVYARLREQM